MGGSSHTPFHDQPLVVTSDSMFHSREGGKGSRLQAILESGRLRIIDDLEAYLAPYPESTSTSCRLTADYDP